MDLQRRIERLERQNRILTAVLVTIGAVGGIGFLLGAGSNGTGTLEAERLILKDSNGKKRAELGVKSERDDPSAANYRISPGCVYLQLLNDEEKEVAGLSQLG